MRWDEYCENLVNEKNEMEYGIWNMEYEKNARK